MPVSERKKKTNQRWDAANMKVLGCKVRKEYAEEAHAAAAAAGTTVNAVLRRALDALIDGNQDGTSILTPHAAAKAQEAATAAGVDVSQWLQSAIETQAQRDALLRRMK